MERKKLLQLIEYLKKEIDKEINDRLPRKVGVLARNFFTQNFKDAGWRDGVLPPGRKQNVRQQRLLMQNIRR